jgi:hypothetical protein
MASGPAFAEGSSNRVESSRNNLPQQPFTFWETA